MIYYTGIGSRLTPLDVLERIKVIAAEKARAGLVLRSGAAPGADTAFEEGAVKAFGGIEIWLPWPRFQSHPSELFPTTAAFEMAARVLGRHHWAACSRGSRALHARNCHQVLGTDLKTPSSQLICWTPRGAIIGGTATALKIATDWRIPITNLGRE